jgi:hypothetical protein
MRFWMIALWLSAAVIGFAYGASDSSVRFDNAGFPIYDK